MQPALAGMLLSCMLSTLFGTLLFLGCAAAVDSGHVPNGIVELTQLASWLVAPGFPALVLWVKSARLYEAERLLQPGRDSKEQLEGVVAKQLSLQLPATLAGPIGVALCAAQLILHFHMQVSSSQLVIVKVSLGLIVAGLAGAVWGGLPDVAAKLLKDGGICIYRPDFHGALMLAGLGKPWAVPLLVTEVMLAVHVLRAIGLRPPV